MSSPSPAATFLPLGRYRVLDLSDETGALCGRLLGDLGADVLKVEPPGGDPSRNRAPFYHDEAHPEKSLSWWAYNCNKRGITLDIAAADGKVILKRLVATAHFFITTFPPNYMPSLGLGYSELAKLNPGLIEIAITPFGREGPYSAYTGDDIVAMAAGGMMNLCGTEDRPPLRMGIPQSHAFVGAQAAVGAMIAHAKRLATGEGSSVDVSMQEAVANMLTNTQQHWFAEKEVEHRGEKHLYGGRLTRGVFPAKDGYIASHIFWGPGPGGRMRGLAQWMQDKGFETTIKNTDFNKVTGGAITQGQVDAWEGEMAAFFSRFTKDEIYREALRRRAFLFPVSSPRDLLENEQLKARGFFEPVNHPEMKADVIYPGAFLRYHGAAQSIRRRPPLIGEHNSEVYVDELGYSRDELICLAEAGVI